jgi:glycosyltransferase involved in cell wall biosynthesis
MEKNKKNAKLGIWAHIPPPYGGMTVHVSRLLPILEEHDISYQMYSFDKVKINNNKIYYVRERPIKWLFRILFGQIEDIQYVFTTRTLVRFLAVIIGKVRRKKIILRIGGESLKKSLNSSIFVGRYLSKFAIRNATAIIGVSMEICRQVINTGVESEKVHHIPGFIPPIKINHDFPNEIKSFLKNKNPRLLISGQLFPQGNEDIYGIFPMIKIMPELINRYPDVGLVIVCYEVKNNRIDIFNVLSNIIEKMGLSNNILLYLNSGELWPIISETDIYIRNTRSDGDANSIREAISLGIPVIASNCTKRPESVITFNSFESNSLICKIYDVIENYNTYKEKVAKINLENNGLKIIALIKSLEL